MCRGLMVLIAASMKRSSSGRVENAFNMIFTFGFRKEHLRQKAQRREEQYLIL